jgi:hypothetical protein
MLLDSNIIIYAFHPAYPQLADFFVGKWLFASAITRLEILGYHRLSPTEVEDFRQFCQVLSMLPVDDKVIDGAITLRRQRNMGIGDAIIAATALAQGLPLITHNVRDFQGIAGLALIDPLAESPP